MEWRKGLKAPIPEKAKGAGAKGLKGRPDWRSTHVHSVALPVQSSCFTFLQALSDDRNAATSFSAIAMCKVKHHKSSV
ncbi:MAG: hypothetical protein LBU76_10865 [Azoarcus sp.]|jgi:hypothetical protein|nr:hypothetical protein [Azoarcus sp.]